MANIKSDNDGFLIGEPLDLNRTFDLWSDIRNDMRAIRLALNGKGDLSPGRPVSNKRAADTENTPQQPTAIPRRRDEGARGSSTPANARETLNNSSRSRDQAE